MFELIKSVLFGVELTNEIKLNIDEEVCKQIYLLSKRHDIAHIVWYALKKAKLDLSQEIKKRFEREQMIAVFRYERQNYELKRICAEFEKAHIDFIPLKGAVLRELYTEEWLRTSCDIDVLVKKADFEMASELVQTNLGYVPEVVSTHDIGFTTMGDTSIELHYSLIEDLQFGNLDKPLQDVWETAKINQNTKHHYLLPNESLYYYNLAHMAKHFVHGGCGIRPLMDLMLMKEKLNVNQEKLDEMFINGELEKFREQAELLSKIWFCGETHTELTLKIEQYILDAGVYGSSINQLMINQAKKGGKSKYAFSRIWLSYSLLKKQYPILEKQKWLYPFCQIARWFRLVFGGRLKYSMTELRNNRRVKEKERDDVVALLGELGLGVVLKDEK